MYLVEFTINSTLHRISNEAIKHLTHQWRKMIMSIMSISYATSYPTGGYVKPVFGLKKLNPKLFRGSGDYPPPDTCPVKVMVTNTTEAAAVTMFEGTDNCVSCDRGEVVYESKGGDFSTTINDVTWNDTLATLFTTYCGASFLNLTFSNQSSRASSINVDRSGIKRDENVLDLLSRLAASFNHYFTISGSTLTLRDMLVDNGTSTIKKIFDPKYTWPKAFKLFQSGEESVPGTKGYGDVKTTDVDEFSNSIPDIISHLGDTKTICERKRAQVSISMDADTLPAIGEKVSWTDTKTPPDVLPGQDEITISAWIRVRSIRTTDNGNIAVLEGEGQFTKV